MALHERREARLKRMTNDSKGIEKASYSTGSTEAEGTVLLQHSRVKREAFDTHDDAESVLDTMVIIEFGVQNTRKGPTPQFCNLPRPSEGPQLGRWRPAGTRGHVRRHLCGHQWGAGATGLKEVEARNAAQRPAMRGPTCQPRRD